MIDSMLQEGTDAALDDQVTRPRPEPASSPAFNLLGLGAAPFRGIGGGVAKSLAFGAEVVGAFGQAVRALDQATPEQRRKNDRQGLPAPDMSNPVGDALRARAAEILPDPQTAHVSEQVVAGLADFATRAVGYGVTMGPLGAVALAGDVGLDEADRLKQQGVDIDTRTKAGATAGAIAGVSVAVPMLGSTRLMRGATGLIAGETGIVGQALAERQILRAAGYDKLADTFDPLDPVALAIGAVPGVLGFAMPVRRTVPVLRTERDVRAAAQLTPAEAAREAAYERSPANLRALEEAIAQEKRPAIRAELEAELRKQQAAAAGEHAVERAVQADPDLAPAARVGQVADALEASRLTPDADLAGRDAHLSAVELAADQMGRGDRVEVAHIIPEPEPPLSRVRIEDTRDGGLHLFALDDRAGQQIGSGLAHETSETVRIRNIGIDAPEAKGKVLGVEAYQEWADYALQRGKTLVSDNQVSPDAQRIYSALERRGYTVERNPKAITEPDGTLYSRGWGVYRVTARPESAAIRPLRTAAAADELRAARPQAQAAERAPSRADVRSAEAARPEPTSAEPTAKATPGPQEARSGAAGTDAPSSVARAADEAAKLDPDMLVQLEGMDAPMRVGDLLAKVQEEARQDTLMGKLVEVAAACDLSS